MQKNVDKRDGKASLISGRNTSCRISRYFEFCLFFIFACLIASCASAPKHKTNLEPKLYPNAFLAEPIKLRAGFVHVTQKFEIAKMDEVWEVNIGFKRVDDKLPVNRFFCLVESRLNKFSRDYSKCTNDEPGVNLRWELIDGSGEVIRYQTYDALKELTGSQSSRDSFMLGLHTFYTPYKGLYRLKITMLRDFQELDITDQHIVLDRPFFGFMRH